MLSNHVSKRSGSCSPGCLAPTCQTGRHQAAPTPLAAHVHMRGQIAGRRRTCLVLCDGIISSIRSDTRGLLGGRMNVPAPRRWLAVPPCRRLVMKTEIRGREVRSQLTANRMTRVTCKRFDTTRLKVNEE